MTAPVSAEVKEEAHKLFLAGKRAFEIQEELGLKKSTIGEWVRRWQIGGEKPQITNPGDVREMQIAALENQLRQLKSGSSPICTPLWNEDTNLTALWKAAEIENEKRIEKALLMAHFEAALPAKPCAVAFVSDQHISVGNVVDLKRMREDAELIAATEGCYAILGGDGIDNHIKHRAATIAARSQPGDQWQLFSWYLGIFAEKILAVVSGNHDDWTAEIAGVDVLRIIAQQHKICFAPDEARIKVNVGDTLYKLAVRHQYRMNSSFNLGHAVKQWWRNGDGDFDIGCICHHHEPHVESFTGHGEEKYCCRPGSYQITSAYSRKYGYNPTTPTCPTFILFPDRKEIVGFRDIRPALTHLRAVR